MGMIVGAGIKKADIDVCITHNGRPYNIGRICSANPVLNAYYQARLWIYTRIIFKIYDYVDGI